MPQAKLLFGVACLIVGALTMYFGKMFAQTWSDLILSSIFGAFLVGVGAAFLAMSVIDRVRKKP